MPDYLKPHFFTKCNKQDVIVFFVDTGIPMIKANPEYAIGFSFETKGRGNLISVGLFWSWKIENESKIRTCDLRVCKPLPCSLGHLAT